MPHRSRCAPAFVLVVVAAAVFGLLVSPLTPAAVGQCELRWRKMFESRALPAVRDLAVADAGDGTLLGMESISVGAGTRMWRSRGSGWEDTGIISDTPFPRTAALDAARGRVVAFRGGGSLLPFPMSVWHVRHVSSPAYPPC